MGLFNRHREKTFLIDESEKPYTREDYRAFIIRFWIPYTGYDYSKPKVNKVLEDLADKKLKRVDEVTAKGYTPVVFFNDINGDHVCYKKNNEKDRYVVD